MQVTDCWADGLGQPLAMCCTFTVQQRYRTIRSEARANVTRHMNKATAGSYWRLLWSAVCRVLVMAWRALLLKSCLARISGISGSWPARRPCSFHITGASEVQYAIIRLGRMAIPKVTGVEMFFFFYFFNHSSERKLSEARAAALWPAKTFQLGRFDTAWDTYDIIIHHL